MTGDKSVRPLRKPTIVDYIHKSTTAITTFLATLFGFAVFILLVYGAFQDQTAFALLALRLALLIISALAVLVALNVIQRSITDGRDRRRQQLREKIAAVIRQIPKLAAAERSRLLMPYLNRIAIIADAAGELPEPEQQILWDQLIAMGAADQLEHKARHSRQKWLRVEALVLMGRLGSTESLAVLNDAVHDPDPDIDYAACRALSEYHDSVAAYTAMLDALSEGRLSRSRTATFIEVADCSKALYLLTERADDPDPKVRFWIAYLLGRKRDPGALPLLNRMAEDPDAKVRANVARALGDIGESQSVPTIKNMLRDEDWLVRARAAKAAGAIRSTELIDDLLPLLRDRQWWVRQNVVLALERIGRESAAKVEVFLNDDDRFARNKAAEVLGRLGIVNDRIAALAGPPAAAEKAREFLIKVGRAEAVNIIEESIPRADPDTQAALTDILREVG